MTVYVDTLIAYPMPASSGSRYFGNGRLSCHLTADSVDELHAFAAKIGLRRSWFQPHSHPHYDLTPKKRALAVRLGAIEETTLDGARRRRTQREMQ